MKKWAQDVVVRNEALRRGLEEGGGVAQAEVPSHCNERLEVCFYQNRDKPVPVNPIGQLRGPRFREEKTSLISDGTGLNGIISVCIKALLRGRDLRICLRPGGAYALSEL